MKNSTESPKNTNQTEKKVWQPMTLVLISNGYVNGGPVNAHKEHSFHFVSSFNGHKYGHVPSAGGTLNFTTQLSHS